MIQQLCTHNRQQLFLLRIENAGVPDELSTRPWMMGQMEVLMEVSAGYLMRLKLLSFYTAYIGFDLRNS